VVDDLGRLDQVGEVIEGLDWQRELAAGKALADAFSTGEKKANVADYDHVDGSHTEGSAGMALAAAETGAGGGDDPI
jgi:hypothetical protein